METAEAETEVEEETEAVEVPSEVAEEAGKVANGEPPKEMPTQSLSEAQRDHYEAIIQKQREVAAAQLDYDITKEQAAGKKKWLELVANDLSCLIADGPQRPDPQKKLPFDGDGTADQKASHHDTDEVQEKMDNWQLTPVTEILTLTDKQREKLEDAGIWTIGQFEHVRGGRHADYPDGLRSIKGVGEKTVDKWEDEVVEWLAKNAREEANESDEP